MARDDDEVARRVLAQKAYGPIHSATYADALKSAQANEMARRLGMPADVVAADYPNMLAEDRLQKRLPELKRNPAYARVMAKPEFAAAAIDDDNLPKVAERVGNHARRRGLTGTFLDWPLEIGAGIGRRVVGLGAGLQSGVGALAGAVGATSVASAYQRDAARNRAISAGDGTPETFATWEDVKRNPLNAPQFGVEQILLSSPDMLASLNPVSLAAYIFARAGEIGQQRAEANGETDASLRDVTIAAPFAAASSLLERVGAKGIISGVRGGTARTIGTAGAREAGTEFVQGSLEYGGARFGTEAGVDQAEALEQAIAGAVGGAFGGGGVAGVGAGVKKFVERQQDVEASRRIDGIMESAQESAVRSANPTGFAEAVQSLVADTGAENIYVPVETLQTMFQDGDVREDPFWSKYTPAIEEAAALGGDVIIPLSDAATNLEPAQWQQLREHVRASPKGQSIAEARDKQTPEELEKLAADVSSALEGAGRTAMTRQALAVTQNWSQGMGYKGEKAKALNRMLSGWLVNAHTRENAKLVAAGAPIASMEDFAAQALPTVAQGVAARMDTAARDTVAGKPIRKVTKKSDKPMDVIGFVRSMGGIQDTEGHNLSKGRDFRKRPGLLNNKRGRTIDEIGEMLHEAGYFNTAGPRPSTAQVLEMLDRGMFEKVYRDADLETVLDRETATREENADAEAINLIEAEFQEKGFKYTAEEVEAALDYVRMGDFTPYEATRAVIFGERWAVLDEVAEESEEAYSLEDAADEASKQRVDLGSLDEGVPGFDDFAGPSRTGSTGAAQSPDYFPGDDTLNQSGLFDDPDQPYRSMTPQQRAEMAARLQQSMIRRGGQESVKDQEGGLFSAERDQDTLFQRQQTQTDAFRAWFGDSKVVDENGEPLVVYHGTNQSFTNFARERGGMSTGPNGAATQAFFFTENADEAAQYAENAGERVVSGIDEFEQESERLRLLVERLEREAIRTGNWEPYEKAMADWENLEIGATREDASVGNNLVPVYLAISNPFVMDFNGGKIHFGSEDYEAIVAQAKADGHDGLFLRNISDSPKGGIVSNHYAAFQPTQIKSALGNRGTFDPRDPNILNDSARGSITLTRNEAGFMSAALIRAFESADFSTAVHELGHFFLEDLRNRVFRDDATDQERADWQTFKDWAFETSGLLVSDQDLIPVEAHEYFARGVERYVWEGVAPSKGLRALFSKMREFMLEIYRTAVQFNAPITPEIREVIGRMLASDAEVADATEEMRLSALAIGDLLTEQEKAEHGALADEARMEARDGLFERVLSALRAEKTAEFRERKREFKSEAEAIVDAEPVFTALRLLRTGIPSEDGPYRVRLSREWIADTYGEEAVNRLPKGVPPIVGDDGTIDADTLATLAGFESGDAMVKALFEVEAARMDMREGGDKRSPRAKIIDGMVDARIREEIGDPFANLEDEASAALANDRQAEVLSLELRAIARKAGKRPTAWQAAVEWSREYIAARTTQDALSGRMLQMYARNASKAGQAVEEALIAKDFDAAFTAKQRQLLNLALLQEARKAKDAVDKAHRRMKRIAERATIPSVDQDYLDQAHQLLEEVDLKDRPQSRIDKRLQFEAWHNQQVANGIEPVVPPEYRAILGKTNWTRLAIDELLELDRVVGQTIELGRLKQRLKDGKKQRDYEEGVAEMGDAAAILDDRAKGQLTDERRTIPQRARSALRSADAAMLTVERVVNWMDNGPNGPWTRLIYQPMAEAQGREKDLMRSYVEQVNALIKSLPSKLVKGWDRKVDTPELVIRNPNHTRSGEAWAGTKDQIVMMAMNWGNDGNRQRLVDGFGWQEEQVEAVFARLMTKEDWDFVQSTWDIVDTLWPEIEQLERRVNGVAPEKVEAVEVQTAFGTYRGGYFPAVYDPTQSTAAALNEEDSKSPHGGYHNVTTRAGASKARSAMVKNRPMLLSMDVITRHMGEVIHDITHREAVGQVRKLLSDKRVSSALNRKLGPEYAKAMGGWMENIAKPGTAYSKGHPALVAIGRYLHKAVSLVGLGFRVTTVGMQALGLPTIAGELGSVRVANAMRTLTAHPVKTLREIRERSAFMRSRFDTLDASMEQMVAEATSGKLRTIGEKGLVKYAFHGIAYADQYVAGVAWIGGFNKGLEQGLGEEEAGLYADEIVRKTQGAGGNADRSAILNQHPLVRSFYPFFSYLNALYGMQRDIARTVARGVRNRDAGDIGEAARRAWWMMVVPIVVQALIFGEGPESDDEESWAAYITKMVVMGNLSSIPGVGAISAALGSGYGYRASAIQSVGEGIIKARSDAAKAIEEGEDYELTGSVVKRTMTTLGLITAQPLGQIGATAGGAYDYATGEAEPEDVGDVYELVTKGKVSDGPTAAEELLGEE